MPPQDTRQLAAWTILSLAVAVIGLWALYLARFAVLIVYVSVLFTLGLLPLVRAIERQKLVKIGTRRLPRWAAILAMYLAVIGVAAGIGAMVVPPLVAQADELAAEVPRLLDRGQQWLVDVGLLAQPLTLQEAMEQAPGSTSDAAGLVVEGLSSIGRGLFGLVTTLILTFYLLLEIDAILAGFIRLFPSERRRAVAEATRTVSGKVSAWLGGQMILALAIGGSAAIGLFLMGVPYFYVLALIAAVGEVIPVLGPLLAALPAVGVALSESPGLALGVAAFYMVQQQFENHVLVPKVMQRQVGVSPVTVIVALLVGGAIWGFVGVLLAVPTAAIVQVVAQEAAGRLREPDRREGSREPDARREQARGEDVWRTPTGESPPYA